MCVRACVCMGVLGEKCNRIGGRSRADGGCLTGKSQGAGFKWMCGELARGCNSSYWVGGW